MNSVTTSSVISELTRVLLDANIIAKPVRGSQETVAVQWATQSGCGVALCSWNRLLPLTEKPC